MHPGRRSDRRIARLGAAGAHGHIVSGASTLTMQAVRLLERRPRTLAAKLTEMARRWRSNAAFRQGRSSSAST